MKNHQIYESREVVEYYEKQNLLQHCEEYLFRKYLNNNISILDIGVGGGRTTLYLTKLAARYIGIDYSDRMVEACRKRFPSVEFRHCDATDLHEFSAHDFDAVIFSFNGIDYIPTDEDRARCFSEIARVLKPGGVFIFSSHNANMMGFVPPLAGAKLYQIIWRIVLSTYRSTLIACRMIMSGVYKSKSGYYLDPVHGGLQTYASTPDTIRPQVEAAGMSVVETVGSYYPRVTHPMLTAWHYYACCK